MEIRCRLGSLSVELQLDRQNGVDHSRTNGSLSHPVPNVQHSQKYLRSIKTPAVTELTSLEQRLNGTLLAARRGHASSSRILRTLAKSRAVRKE